MLDQVLDRAAGPCNSTPVAPPPTAGEILGDWVVQIPRRMILPGNLGALVAWAISVAWEGRGIPGPPPGGWPRLARTSPRNWRRWRESAISLGLIEMRHGRIVPVARLQENEQFSRVPLKVIFDPNLSRTAIQIYVSLALFRTGLGYSRASIRTLSKTSGLDPRNVRKGLRSLEDRFHITACGATGMGVQRYFLGGQTTPAGPNSGTETYPPYPQNGQKRPPYQRSKADKNAPPKLAKADKNAPPKRTKTPPLLQEYKNLESQEGRAPPAPGDSQAPRGPTKAAARDVLNRYGLTAAGIDFGKPDGLQGKKARAEQWQTLRDDLRGQRTNGGNRRKFLAGWTAQDFKAAIASATESMGGATGPERRTLRATIADFTNELERTNL